MELYLNHAVTTFEMWIPKLWWGTVILIAFTIGAAVAKKLIMKVGKKVDYSRVPLYRLLGQTAKVTILIIGIVTALGSIGVNINALVASLGLSGFALGFAMKDMLSNTLAGILVLLYQPFKLGDNIEVNKFQGNVIEINLRYTMLDNNESKILVPNATILNNPVIVSYSSSPSAEKQIP